MFSKECGALWPDSKLDVLKQERENGDNEDNDNDSNNSNLFFLSLESLYLVDPESPSFCRERMTAPNAIHPVSDYFYAKNYSAAVLYKLLVEILSSAIKLSPESKS